jgi:hypothetical protein
MLYFLSGKFFFVPSTDFEVEKWLTGYLEEYRN